MPKKEKPTAYQDLSSRLDAVLSQIQQPDVEIDEAVKLYEEGLALAIGLEKYLAQTENTIKKMKLKAPTNEDI